MPLWNRIRYFYAFDRRMKMLILEAYIHLAWARLLKGLPFSKVAINLGHFNDETDLSPQPQHQQLLKYISEAIHIASRYTFWESQCMVKAIAGMNMLRKRGLESTIYFGTARDKSGKLIAHAWLRSGSIYLSGAEEMDIFTVVGKYARKIN